MQPPANFEAILTALDAAGVEFVIVGGLALVARGGPRSTVDVPAKYWLAPRLRSRTTLPDQRGAIDPAVHRRGRVMSVGLRFPARDHFSIHDAGLQRVVLPGSLDDGEAPYH